MKTSTFAVAVAIAVVFIATSESVHAQSRQGPGCLYGASCTVGSLIVAPSTGSSNIFGSSINGGGGNLILAVPNSDFLRASIGGTTVFQIDTEVRSYLPAEMLSSGVVPNANGYSGQIHENINYSGGGNSVGNRVSANLFQANSDTVNAPSSFSILTIADSVGGSLAYGPRSALNASVGVNSTTGNAAKNSGVSYVAISGSAIGNANDGGIPGSENSVVFGANIVAVLGPAASYWQGAVGTEFDINLAAGSSALDKIGVDIAQINSPNGGDAVQGSRTDAALLFGNQALTQTHTVGWKNVIQFGGKQAIPPCSYTLPCTLIFAQPPTLGSVGENVFNATNGIDFSLVTFTGNSWNDGHVAFNAAGAANLNAGTALPLSATDGFVSLPFTAGIPTGAPTTNDSCAIDITNGYINCYYSGTWHKIAFTNGAG